jgi:hypothetical protein
MPYHLATPALPGGYYHTNLSGMQDAIRLTPSIAEGREFPCAEGGRLEWVLGCQ